MYKIGRNVRSATFVQTAKNANVNFPEASVDITCVISRERWGGQSHSGLTINTNHMLINNRCYHSNLHFVKDDVHIHPEKSKALVWEDRRPATPSGAAHRWQMTGRIDRGGTGFFGCALWTRLWHTIKVIYSQCVVYRCNPT